MGTSVTQGDGSRVDITRRYRRTQHRTIQLGMNRGPIRTLWALERVSLAYPIGRPFPSQRKLAEIAGCSVRTIQRQSRQLEDAQLLRVRRSRPQRGPNGRFTRRTNRYFVLDGNARAGARREKEQNRRSHLGDIRVAITEKREASKPPLLTFGAETDAGAPIRVLRPGDFRALLPPKPR